jgi:SWI/SNF-related matrix-associated actin-dependent regulator of chromatin subfamily A member 5
MLRRVKKDVAHALPPKKETKLFIGLTDMQVEYYTKILKKESVEINAIGGPAKTALQNVLMQLRKVCNHPYLFTGAEPGPPYSDGPHLWENSGKMQLLHKLLAKLKQQGSRVLIFSQMTRVLDILEDYLNFVGEEYCRIDGNTDGDERDEQMNEFNEENSSKFCFLLSTRAGGLGINLQTADIVILYDSDWNPQVDLQAMDRAHRIGQKKPVQVFRFVTEGSVEEKITECADRKLFLDAAVIQQGRLAEKSNNMDKDEMMKLVTFGAEQIMQSKGATYSDEDIDALLRKGEERTEAMNAKLQTDVQHNLATFSLMGDDEEGGNNLYTFGGVDHKNGANRAGMMLNLGQRERKKLYELDTGPVVVPVSKEVLAQRKKMRKRDAMKDFQFFDKERLQAIFTREEKLEEDKVEFSKRIQALRDEAKEAPSVKSEKIDVEKGKSYEEINAKADKMQEWLDGEGAKGTYCLSDEEVEEKERLIDEGFGDWSASDFRLFTSGLETHGRYNVEEIAEDFLENTVHSKENVYKYYVTFMKRYKEIKDYGKIWERCDKALEKAAKEKRTKLAMEWFYEGITESNFWRATLPGSRVTWSEEEDKFLIYALWKYGSKNTETIRAAIQMSPR